MLRGLDLALLRALRTRGHARGLEEGAKVLSRAGEHGQVWLAAAAAGSVLDPGRRPVYVRAGCAVIAAFSSNQAIKYALRRPRPVLDGLPPLAGTISGLSYPSAHATTSFAAAGALSRALPAPVLYTAAAAMALSRPYLGVHYPSDVLAGALLGAAVEKLVP